MIPDLTRQTQCCHCGNWHQGVCPRIKLIEYNDNGTVKRVEYHEQFAVAAVNAQGWGTYPSNFQEREVKK